MVLERLNRFGRTPTARTGSAAIVAPTTSAVTQAAPSDITQAAPRSGSAGLLRVLSFTSPGDWSDAQCAALRTIDPAALTQSALLDYVEAIERQKAHLEALQLKALAVMDRRDSSGLQAAREEVACVLRIAPLAAARRLEQARALVDHLPLTLAVLTAGDLSLPHTNALVAMAGRVDPSVAAQVEAAVLTDATHLTPQAVNRAVNRAVLAADPGGCAVRQERAVADRYVTVAAADDGMAWLNVYGPGTDVQTMYTRLDAAARLLPRDDARTLPQRRFDLLVDGLLTGIPADGLPTAQGRSPQIQVTVAATTLLGQDDQPAELAGYGAIDADVARQLAADPTGTWRRIVTDPVSGQILDYGRTTYRPPKNLIDHVTSRDRTCRFPGCSMLAHRADLDHIQPCDEGGETEPGNLAVLCRRHHELKTKKYWLYEMEAGGALNWTSPAAKRYRTAAWTSRPENRHRTAVGRSEPHEQSDIPAVVNAKTRSEDGAPPF